MSFQVRAATSEDARQAIALLGSVWAGQANEAMLTRAPGYEPHQTRVGVLDGRVVAMAQVIEREMWIGERTVKLGYVGNVVAAAEHRRKGYASAILRDVASYMQARGYDLGLLHAAVPELYEKHGWQIVRERITAFGLTDSARRPLPSRYVVRQGDWDRDLEAIAAIYDDYIVEHTGAARRSLDYWRASREWVRHEDPSRFIVVEAHGEVVAYSRGEGNHNVIMELAYRAGHAAALPSLFAAIGERYDLGPFCAYLPADPTIEAFLDENARNVSHAPERLPDYEPAMALPLKFQDLAALDGMCFYAADHF